MKLYFLPLALFLSFFASPAYAYIDPGMGSMWIQALIAFIAGFGVTVKIYWQKIKYFFSKDKKDVCLETKAENDNQDEYK